MNEINWKRKALKQLGKIHKAEQVRIYDATQALAYMPTVQNIKGLTNHQYGYRGRQLPRDVRLGRRR